MSRKRPRESSPSSPPSRKSRRFSGQNARSERESRQTFENSLSPPSSTSSTLSLVLDSDYINDPFKTETPTTRRRNAKRTDDEIVAPAYEAPVTRATLKQQTPIKKRKVHFEEEDIDSERKSADSKSPRRSAVYLEGLDAPFNTTNNSIFTKSDDSKKQKAWSTNYRSFESNRKEAIETRKSALGPDLKDSRASTPTSFVSNTPSKRGRGNGRRGRGRGGRGGRGRGGGRAGRNEDSPEPPKKRIITEAEKEILADLKARQSELKKFFKEAGPQQIEALNVLATRDLGKIARKSKAHEKVPEYDLLVDALRERREAAEQLVRRRYDYDLQQAKILHDAEKDVIEQRYKASFSSPHDRSLTSSLDSLLTGKVGTSCWSSGRLSYRQRSNPSDD